MVVTMSNVLIHDSQLTSRVSLLNLKSHISSSSFSTTNRTLSLHYVKVRSYGLPKYGTPNPNKPAIPNPYKAPAVVPTPADATVEPSPPKFWAYGAPKPYTTPPNYTTPINYSAPSEYGPPAATATVLGGGDGGNDGSDGNGGDGGGGDEGGDSSEGNSKKLSVSQIITLVYAALIAVGGLIGFFKKGSAKSLIASLSATVVLLVVFKLLPTNALLASVIGLAVSALLAFVMGLRFSKSGKVFPAGVVAGISVITSAGYIHGIARST